MAQVPLIPPRPAPNSQPRARQRPGVQGIAKNQAPLPHPAALNLGATPNAHPVQQGKGLPGTVSGVAQRAPLRPFAPPAVQMKAPPVYRPNNGLPRAGTAQLAPRAQSGAPPVYRPDRSLPTPPLVANRSAAAQLSSIVRPAPPPVYRPSPAVHATTQLVRGAAIAQPKIAARKLQPQGQQVIQRMMTASEPAEMKIVKTSSGLTLTGRLEENGAAITGDVLLEEYAIDPSGAGKTPPVKITGKAHESKGTARALRVHNINVKPMKLGLGDFLLSACASEAKSRGIPYLLGMNCVDAARSWYFRMGFAAYSAHKSFEALTERKQMVDTQIRESKLAEQAEMLLAARSGIQEDLESVEALAMFAPVDTVISRATESIKKRWMKVAEDRYFAVERK